jgi:hypothetical protein
VEGIILLIAGAGLSSGRSWAWRVSLGIIIVGIITSILVLYPLGSVRAVPALIVNFGLLYYIMRGNVRDFFRVKLTHQMVQPQTS